jgi:hypothetical protein|tara:strand:+ start:379 stop:615 length:237 start_codon:yes stop_codon:yes gene_type:complete
MTESPTESPDMNAVQNELMDMIIADESPSNISDRIKDMLFAKSAEKIDSFKPEVANSTFNSNDDDSGEAPVSTEDGVE